MTTHNKLSKEHLSKNGLQAKTASNRLLLKKMQNENWDLGSLALFVALCLKNSYNCEISSFYDLSL